MSRAHPFLCDQWGTAVRGDVLSKGISGIPWVPRTRDTKKIRGQFSSPSDVAVPPKYFWKDVPSSIIFGIYSL